ncbi:phosphatidate cytidylyltransferase, mitochondrial [Diaphorina citri]|uniref:Phosphatidate cytidylyltransferase, mitochondrial n=1 Tax=Diaphorina citri TaxID=121845 RepID=A0A1S3DJ07_DIACI|nr:phosphatidate cytidylyltransferase, mitochondrial [Diaphorina citri]
MVSNLSNVTSKALTKHDFFQIILNQFPTEYVVHAFGYGSGVFQQANKSSIKSMVDIILVVNDSEKFHSENLIRNNNHYSFLKYFGPGVLKKVQENYGSKMYFNTHIPMDDLNVTLKYGIINRQHFLSDLLDWQHLYVAGRLHKPVFTFHKLTNYELSAAIHLNLTSAVHAALLLLPEHFSEYDLLSTITNLSYSGDFRMTFGENKNKIDNIVQGQLEQFRLLYSPIVNSLQSYCYLPKDCITNKNGSQDMSPLARQHHLNKLPYEPQCRIVQYWNHQYRTNQDTEDVLGAVAHDPDVNIIVENALRQIVASSSIRQSIKGIATAGLFKSVVYSYNKVQKMMGK